jgi:hypothetical protein
MIVAALIHGRLSRHSPPLFRTRLDLREPTSAILSKWPRKVFRSAQRPACGSMPLRLPIAFLLLLPFTFFLLPFYI